MSSFSLPLDLGPTYMNQPFRVRLDAGELDALIEDTGQASRIYELMLIERPGDVLDYLWVIPLEVSEKVQERIASARRHAKGQKTRNADVWPDDRMPLTAFDNLFCWAAEDTEPDDEVWLRFRESSDMRSFIRSLFAAAVAAQNQLASGDALQRHVYSQLRAGAHPYGFISRQDARTKCRNTGRAGGDRDTSAFYDTLSRLLKDPELAAVAYRGSGDYRVLRMMATEQRRRANYTGHDTDDALFLSAMNFGWAGQDEWGSSILFFDEGLGYGDLFVQGSGLGSDNIARLMRSGRRPPRRYLLTTESIGELAGFEHQSGDGWVLYTKMQPSMRRQSLQLVQYLRFRQRTGAEPVLSFADGGASVFYQERSLVVVGDSVCESAREVLAGIVTGWQREGGDPVVLVLGNAAPFHQVGCRDTLVVPPNLVDDSSRSNWLFNTLRWRRPWIDVVLALHAPAWVQELLSNMLDDFDRPWKAWVAATGNDLGLTVDCRLEGDLEQVLTEAALRARAIRPKQIW